MCFRPATASEVKCPNCGQSIPFGMDECLKCGTKVTGSEAGTASPGAPGAPGAPAAPAAPAAPGAPQPPSKQ